MDGYGNKYLFKIKIFFLVGLIKFFISKRGIQEKGYVIRIRVFIMRRGRRKYKLFI